MNVYSVRLIPQLKIRLCQFFGMATSLALGELTDRIRRIDQKIDRFDGQLRRIHRRQMAMEATQAQRLEAEKKSQLANPKRLRKSG